MVSTRGLEWCYRISHVAMQDPAGFGVLLSFPFTFSVYCLTISKCLYNKFHCQSSRMALISQFHLFHCILHVAWCIFSHFRSTDTVCTHFWVLVFEFYDGHFSYCAPHCFVCFSLWRFLTSTYTCLCKVSQKKFYFQWQNFPVCNSCLAVHFSLYNKCLRSLLKTCRPQVRQWGGGRKQPAHLRYTPLSRWNRKWHFVWGCTAFRVFYNMFHDRYSFYILRLSVVFYGNKCFVSLQGGAKEEGKDPRCLSVKSRFCLFQRNRSFQLHLRVHFLEKPDLTRVESLVTV